MQQELNAEDFFFSGDLWFQCACDFKLFMKLVYDDEDDSVGVFYFIFFFLLFYFIFLPSRSLLGICSNNEHASTTVYIPHSFIFFLGPKLSATEIQHFIVCETEEYGNEDDLMDTIFCLA